MRVTLGVEPGIGWLVNCRGTAVEVAPALNDPELPFKVDPRLGVETAAAAAAVINLPPPAGPDDDEAEPLCWLGGCIWP